MTIHHLECPDGTKLFSFHRHDYISHTDKKGNYSSLDGGFDYCKRSGPGKVINTEISAVIKDIRQQFTWTKSYSKSMKPLKKPQVKLLKDLTTDHILGILKYFSENRLVDKEFILTTAIKATHLIFIEELLYRSKTKQL